MDLFATALFGRACKAMGSQENMQQGFVTSEVEAADLCRSSGQCHVLFPRAIHAMKESGKQFSCHTHSRTDTYL